jgi:hypothetical protein
LFDSIPGDLIAGPARNRNAAAASGACTLLLTAPSKVTNDGYSAGSGPANCTPGVWCASSAAREKPTGAPLPPAIAFFTNFPYHFVEVGDPLRGQAVLFTGINMPEFRAETADQNLIRTKHAPILELHQSLLRHTAVPHELS